MEIRRSLPFLLALVLSACCNTQLEGSTGGSGTGAASTGSTGRSTSGPTGGSGTGMGPDAGCPDRHCAPGFQCSAGTQDTCICDGNSCLGECDLDAGSCVPQCGDAGLPGWFESELSVEDTPYAIRLRTGWLGAYYGYTVQWLCPGEPPSSSLFRALTPLPPYLSVDPGGTIWGRIGEIPDAGPFEFEIEVTVQSEVPPYPNETHVQNFILDVIDAGPDAGTR